MDRRAAYKKRYPEKNRAHKRVYDAIKRGTLVRQPCEVCGYPQVHAHHDDYTKPLEVRWLCVQHHDQHRQKKCA